MFIFMFPLMAFYTGKYRQAVCQITMAISAATSLLTIIYPDLIYGAGNIENYFVGYLDFHTVTFHNIVIMQFILIVALGLAEPVHVGGIKTVAIFTACFCVISASMAHILQTNFNNFYVCNIAPLESVRLAVQNAVGYVPAQILYVLYLFCDLRSKISLDMGSYFRNVLRPVLVLVFSLAVCTIPQVIFVQEGVARFFAVGFTTVIVGVAAIWFGCLDAKEKEWLKKQYKG
jgi:hypothetical protein